MREWHFQDKVYKRWVVLMICSYEELIEELRKCEYKHIDEVGRAEGYNFRLNMENSNQTCTLIWLPNMNQAGLVHELVHLVMWTFDQCSVLIHLDNEEAFAFLMEYWVAEMNRVYRRYPNGRTAKEARA